MHLYKEDEFFNKKPRFLQQIEELQINVDAPPAKQEDQNNPVLLTVGPMLTMSMTSLMMGYTAVNNVLNNGTSWSSAMPSLVICGAMVCSVLVWPTITKRYEKSRRKKQEKERQKKYGDYINSKKQMINDALAKQSSILRDNFPTVVECEQIILSKLTRLWERRIEDNDFLTVNLGIGSQPLRIDIKYPEDHFSMTEDNLKDMVSELGNTPKNMTSVPIDLSLVETRLVGIISEQKSRSEFVKQLILQMVAFHSYDNLKIVVLTNNETEHYWDFVKILPHNWSNDKTFRFFGTNAEEYKEICYNLERIYNSIKEASTSGKKVDIETRYVIIIDSLNTARNFDFIKNILDEENDVGFSLIMLDNRITNIPDQCKSFVQLNNDKCEYYKTLVNNNPLIFEMDTKSKIDYYGCAKVLANIPIKIDNDNEGQLPNKLGFLEMFDIGKIEQFNLLNRWQKNNPILSLNAPVGLGKSGEKLNIDLHEKYHGPHGLIAGMTGSGKSEFIITYILSMAVNYHPYEVQFILIDYKGGGLAGAFENPSIGLKLPHLVGTITNLDANEIKRSLASIESELKRRQRLFNKARESSGESTIDIYKYQKMYREGAIDEPISHLFIISDEFAELKNQQPEFMDQLISTARIGRSLGVHLILATQKPSGVVDPQIWSNTRFRVCLRVQEKGDSNEVIKCPDAAFLKQTGRFYFQVGYNEIFALGQAAWAGGKYIPSEKIKKNIDSSLKFVDNIGYVLKSVDSKKKVENTTSNGEELINIVKYISNVAKEENIKCKPLWLAKIPDFITVSDLIQEFNYEKKSFNINPIIGKYDNPSMQQQHLLTVPISDKGNALIYGVAGAGKENLIFTMVYSSMLYYLPSELNYYIIDFGSEALRVLKDSPLVGDVLYSDDTDKVSNLYKMILNTIESRKKLFSDYNGDYSNYCKNSGKTVPSIVIIINNYEAYQETYPEYDDQLIILSREGVKYGIYFVITVVTPNGMRFKLKQNFNQEFVLQQNNDDDYTTILGNVYKNYPAKIFGRGIIKTDTVYEFQTAHICETEAIQNNIKNLIATLKTKYPERANPIPVLPEVVTYNSVSEYLNDSKNYIIGLSKQELESIDFDFRKNVVNIITSNDILLNYNFILPFIKQILFKNDLKLMVINAEDYILEEETRKRVQYYDTSFDEVFTKLETYVSENYENYKNNDYNKEIFKDVKPILCIIIGIENFKNRLNDENKLKFASLFDKAKDLDIISYIFIDSVDKIKKVELESWYKNTASQNDGIWIGNGINEQFSLKCNQRTSEMKLEIEDNFCFVIKRGKATLVKFIEEFEEK